MRFLNTKAHAINDYIFGAFLIGIPAYWLNTAPIPNEAAWVPIAVGILVLLQSLVTDYEFSLVNLIPVPIHLLMDIGVGLFLAVSPWLFRFDDVVWAPHVIVGVAAIGLAVITQQRRGQLQDHSANSQVVA